VSVTTLLAAFDINKSANSIRLISFEMR